VSRGAGFVIPAGILGGVSLGTIPERATSGLTGQVTGALFVLSLAAGFADRAMWSRAWPRAPQR
jgi:hypothetical protein